MRDSPYYSIRSGKRSPIKFNLTNLKKLFLNLYQNLHKIYYFYECFGYSCYDIEGHVDGSLGDIVSINYILLLKIGREDLWPIEEKIDSYSEDDLFDVIEFLYDCVSLPSDGRYHSYNDCGAHDFQKFDKTPARIDYRNRINDILRNYKDGYELSEDGHILMTIEYGLDGLISAPLPIKDEETQKKLHHAINKYRRSRNPEERRDALRELADILEFLRPQVKKILLPKDEDELFNILNNFGIRHHNQKQKNDYDKKIFYSWLFYHFLSSIHAISRLIEKYEKCEIS